jgi:CubicO group peptidase (beta-lactamase class C family)
MSELPPDERTVFAGLPFSKPVFAYLVMQLVEDRLLDLDRPLIDYLHKPVAEYPEWKDLHGDDRLREITARRVLMHTTGVLDLLARGRIFTPLNMSRTGYVWEEAFEANHPDGHTERQRRIKMRRGSEPSAPGSLVSTAADYARFAAAVLNGEGLEQSSMDVMLAPLPQ